MKSIGINDSMHKRIRQLSVTADKKIYELILEALNYLEEKYHIARNNVEEENHHE